MKSKLKYLSHFRKKRGLTQVMLAEMVDIGVNSIARYERDEIKPSIETAKKIADAGRGRWKIENQGFNRQKNWDGEIEHMCSWNENAQKNHYLMAQIADFIKQLYEYFYLKKNEIVKTHKKISSDLLNSIAGLFRNASEDTDPELSESVLS